MSGGLGSQSQCFKGVMSEATRGKVTVVGHDSLPEQEVDLDKQSSPSILCLTNPLALALAQEGHTSLSPEETEEIELTHSL